MSLLDGLIDQTLVIALDDSVRLSRIAVELKELQIRWQRFHAYDYRYINLPLMQELGFAKKTRSNGLDFVPGEIACLMSHIGCWMEVVGRDIDRALILEDDAHFCVSAPHLKHVLGQAPADYDMLHLHSLHQRDDQWRANRPQVNKYWRRGYRESAGATAYVLTKKTAIFLLRNCFPAHWCADAVTNRPSLKEGWNAYIADPMLCFNSGEPKQIRRATDGVDPTV